MSFYRGPSYCTVICLGILLVLCESKHSSLCRDVHLLLPRGTIKSPWYPSPYPPHIDCTWTILSPPDTYLTIQVDDFDVQEDLNCTSPPCCSLNYLSLPSIDSNSPKHFCGLNPPFGPFIFKKDEIVVKFKSSILETSARGFSLSYFIGKQQCKVNDFQCGDGRCLPGSLRCDMIPQCSDGSDEIGCGNICRRLGKITCGSQAVPSCFDSAQRCDGIHDCESGRDEIDCDPLLCEFKCRSAGCYTALQKCDGHFDCYDSSDELGCGTCVGSRKQCNNAKCLHPTLWCDGNDDCGDNSDEDNCIRNSVISATIMGCLFCGLMLVIAVMCALRIYSVRNETANYSLTLPHHVAARLSLSHSLSLPVLMDEEILQREPPPAYSVAVGHPDPTVPGASDLVDSSSRRSSSRRHRPRPFVKPPTPPPSTGSSSQSSPSRESVTSSSYLSKDDSAQLLSA